MNVKSAMIPVEMIEKAIFFIRNQRVILDTDLAALYGVQTKVLNQAVKRNERRFPSDFVFFLTKEEKDELVTNCDRLKRMRHSSALPRAFTEQGVAMLSSVLNSERAVDVNIEIMRAFIRLRALLSTYKGLAGKLSELERRLEGHDEKIQVIFQAIKQLMTSPEKPRKKIGFIIKEKQRGYGRLKS
ncbi:MAG: ORF6N domain-containing protein [Nanoarchaeota archaeon]|nr:ORF6N domain-containing protein [Nanoarchaeota archaeon]